MRLGIDAREIEDGVYTGIGTPLASFLRYFAKNADHDECILFSTKPIPINFGKNVKNIVIKEKIRFYWDQIQLSMAVNSNNIDIFYSPYYKIPLFANCTIVSAVLDLMYLMFPPYRKRLGVFGVLYYKIFGKLFSERANRILTCSEYSKEDIIKFYNTRATKIDVIPLSIDDRYRLPQNTDAIEKTKERFFNFIKKWPITRKNDYRIIHLTIQIIP